MKTRDLKLLSFLLSFLVVSVLWFFVTESDDEYGPKAKDRPLELTDRQTTPIVDSAGDEIDNDNLNIADRPSLSMGPKLGSAIAFERLSLTNLEEAALLESEVEHSHKFREWKGRLEPNLNQLRETFSKVGPEGVLAIALPDATEVSVTRLRFESYGSFGGVLTGKILGDRFGEVVLSYVNEAVAGSIQDYRNESVWEIRNAGNGEQFVAQVNALGVCGVCKEHSIQ